MTDTWKDKCVGCGKDIRGLIRVENAHHLPPYARCLRCGLGVRIHRPDVVKSGKEMKP